MNLPKLFGGRLAAALAFSICAGVFVQCADSLDVTNENDPPVEVLSSEEGLRRAALGIWFFDDGQRIADFNWIAQTLHSVMGDETYVPWGNFTWRWANQPTNIVYNNGATTWTPPQGADQGTQLEIFNDRVQEDNNAFVFEWRAMYRINNTSNLILSFLPTAEFEGDAEAKRRAYTAYCRFWKGWAYSRLGAMYSDALIIDTPGETNGDYVPYNEILAEAGRQFDMAVEALTELRDNNQVSEWDILLTAAVPDYMLVDNGSPSVDDMIRSINTMRARNILVSHRAFDIATESLPQISQDDYMAILSLTQEGLEQTSDWLQFRSAASNGVFFQTIWPPYRSLIGWAFISERLVQDYLPGDARYERNVDTLATANVNMRGRGIQYGTRFQFRSISDGGDHASTVDGLAEMPIAGSYWENALMQAEAMIRLGQVDEGLEIIDAVRDAQNAGLDDVSDDGLDADEAYEQLRRERRVGLIFEGLQFYDARRWGVTVPVSLGGGRADAVILDENGDVFEDALINYNYLDFFGVPDDELDFNETDRSAVMSIAPR